MSELKELEVETQIEYFPDTKNIVNDVIIEKKEFNEKEYATKIIDYKIEQEPSSISQFFSDFWDGFKTPYEYTFELSWSMFKTGQKLKNLLDWTLNIKPEYLIILIIIVIIILKKI